MKYIYTTATTLTMTIITVTAQNMSIFSKATQSGWYPEFLNPVIDIITSNAEQTEILDIGTGPGTLPQMLIKKDSSLQIVGIDIDSVMIDEARRRFTHKNVTYQNQKINAALDFPDNQFDMVTFCSVLFLVDDNIKTNLMNEAMRVLKPNGKIIILTPSGRKSILSSFLEVWRYPFSFNNFTFPIWKIATTRGSRKWQRQKWLESYARDNQLNYTSTLTFNNNATLETISKHINN
ncbi:class I SAM-dependent methyltransferase [Algoriphagus sp. C2-6-M1]|uniref:class I SAM-dependent methyltransferase n=1 Tax=Algoriphagus persicinus TaxID=3108754 RepID=UPI002B3908BA|nr:class I SAM-dependent methyltransferase [Algoriphagus sp. C2-6-M1]MEB2782989.1 class I SAM-dependent methyltransferase [Algoriphagus sp. C2-6-M1]